MNSKPKIVCLCGSTRFLDTFHRANLMETLAGRIVLSIGCNTQKDANFLICATLLPETKKKLDELHKRKIDMCDEVFVLNVDDYVGETVQQEIEYAQSIGRPIRWLEGKKEVLL